MRDAKRGYAGYWDLLGFGTLFEFLAFKMAFLAGFDAFLHFCCLLLAHAIN
jgi:hypothetical protein